MKPKGIHSVTDDELYSVMRPFVRVIGDHREFEVGVEEGDLLEMGRELEKLFVEKILEPALKGEVENDYLAIVRGSEEP